MYWSKWKLRVLNGDKIIQENECSSGNSAKTKAKKYWKSNGMDNSLKFYIFDPNNRVVFESVENSVWRLQWRWI